MKTIDTYQPKKSHDSNTIIVHHGVDNHGNPHLRAYEVALCSTCRPGDKRCYSFRILQSGWDNTYERLVKNQKPLNPNHFKNSP